MQNNIKIIKKKIKLSFPFFEKMPVFLALHAFAIFLILLFLNFILSALIFYQYSYLAQSKEIEGRKGLIFEEKIYNNILDILEGESQTFNAVDSKTYINVFKALPKN